MRSLITGATGTIGQQLIRALGGEVTVLSRDPRAAARSLGASRCVAWDGQSALDPALFDGLDAVFHLAGEPVAEGRWTREKKRRIEQSRVLGTRALVEALGRAPRRPRVLVSASAVGIYGSRGDEPLGEESARGSGFLADVCASWEDAARVASSDFGVRACQVRIGIVLARDGGALSKMLPAFKAGVAGRLGDGKQWMPWVHVDDVVGLLVHAASSEGVSGPINAVAPESVTNAEFTRELARALRRPAVLPAPASLLRVAFGELADVMLASQRVEPRVALRAGYCFRHPKLAPALADLVGPGSAFAPAEARP